MYLTIVNQDILVEILSPLYNMLSFEHKPKTMEQKRLAAAKLTTIKNANLININPAAQCQLKQQSMHNPFEDASNQSDHKDISFEYQ